MKIPNNPMRNYKAIAKSKVMALLEKSLDSTRSMVLTYSDSRAPVMDRINRIKKETHLVMGKNEAYQIYAAVKNTRKIPGDIAEVGVYAGGSARLIAETKGDKELYLFDTFEGLPEVSKEDSSKFYKSMYAASFEEVSNYVQHGGIADVFIYKGYFPDTAGPIKNKRFSFVHLDADIYQSTKDAIEFFYPRMNRGGVMISHDYINAQGVRKAFDDFFRDKPEPLIEISGSQILVVKL
jgi:O-methyltransferase